MNPSDDLNKLMRIIILQENRTTTFYPETSYRAIFSGKNLIILIRFHLSKRLYFCVRISACPLLTTFAVQKSSHSFCDAPPVCLQGTNGVNGTLL